MTEQDLLADIESFRRSFEDACDEMAATLRAIADMVTDVGAMTHVDESHGMTIDELLDNVDSALADHRGVKGDT